MPLANAPGPRETLLLSRCPEQRYAASEFLRDEDVVFTVDPTFNSKQLEEDMRRVTCRLAT